MNTIRFRLLGEPAAVVGDQPLVFATQKTLCLLAYLALEPGTHPREQLADLLWPDYPLEAARTNLRRAVYHLRVALGPAADALLLIRRDALELAPSPPLTLDLQLLLDAHRLLHRARPTPGLREHLETAVGAYGGPFMHTVSVPDAPSLDAWLSAQRARWLDVTSELVEHLAEQQIADGDTASALETLERWLSLDPGADEAWQRLLELQLDAGDYGGARRSWAAAQRALADLGLPVGTALEALGGRIMRLPAQPMVARDGGGVPDPPDHLPEVPLIGRAHELSVLRHAFARVEAGQPQLILLEGTAGIGKSRLATDFLAWAEVHGADVLIGHAFETQGTLPYGPVVEALRMRIERENAPVDLLDDVWLAELARVLPELQVRYPDLPPPIDDPTLGQGRLFEAVSRLGQALAARQPVVLCIDDLQWSDRATRDLLRYSMHHWAETAAAVLLVLTVRVEDLGSDRELAQWVGTLERDTPALRLAVERLQPQDVLRWVAALTGVSAHGHAGDALPGQPGLDEPLRQLGRWLADKTGGEPFYVVQTLRALLEEGVLRVVHGHDGWMLDLRAVPSAERLRQLEHIVPAGVRALLAARLARLGEAETDLLVAAAVLGGWCTDDDLYRVAAVDEPIGFRALDRLIDGRLLCIESGGRRYTFSHDMLRTVVYAAAGAAQRRSYHRRALVILEAVQVPAAELARQAVAAGLSEQAIRYSVAAGDAALAVVALQDALAHYEQARQVEAAQSGSAGMAPEQLEHLYTHLGRVYELVQDHTEARAAYAALRERARARGAVRTEIIALLHLGTLAWRGFDLIAARHALAEALQLAEAGGDRAAQVEIGANLAWLSEMGSSPPDDTAGQSAQVLALARELGEPRLLAAALHARMNITAYGGNWDQTVTLAEEALALYVAMDDDSSSTDLVTSPTLIIGARPSRRLQRRAMEADALFALAIANTGTGETRAAIAAARATQDLVQATTSAGDTATSLHDLGYGAGLVYALVDAGGYAEALAVATRALALLRPSDAWLVRLRVPDGVGLARLVVGQLDAAQHVYEEQLHAGQAMGVWMSRYMANERLCAICALNNDWTSARAYATAMEQIRPVGTVPLFNPHLFSYLETAVRVQAGELARAAQDLDQIAVQVGTNRRLRILYLRAHAILVQAHGDVAAAIANLEAARQLAEALELPGERWPIDSQLAVLYRASGNAALAAQAQARADGVVQHLAAGLNDPTLRASFLAVVPRVVTALSVTAPPFDARAAPA